jgi:excisionase family DNA binding protein
MNTEAKRGFTREEAADYVGVSFYKIAAAIRENRLPAKRHGKDVIVLREDLDAFIDQMNAA